LARQSYVFAFPLGLVEEALDPQPADATGGLPGDVVAHSAAEDRHAQGREH
jgi:hypothetical protein